MLQIKTQLSQRIFFVTEINNEPSDTVMNFKLDNQMHPSNAKVVRTIATTCLTDTRTPTTSSSDLSRNNFILVRNSKSSEGPSHILLRTHSKNELLLDDGKNSKMGQIFIQQNEIKKGVIVQSVKKLSSPIIFLSSGEASNGHILIQTTPTEEIRQTEDILEDTSDNILVRALEGIQDGDYGNGRGLSTPIGSGELLIIYINFCFWHELFLIHMLIIFYFVFFF